MPPENWYGYQRSRSSGSGMPTERSRAMAVAFASDRDMPRWKRSDSVIWRPTRTTGLSAVTGSWKTMAICAPQMPCSSSRETLARSTPPKTTLPSRMTLWSGRRPITERERTVLPDPDSPTMPSVWPRFRVNDTPSTERTTPCLVWKCVTSESTSSSGRSSVSSISNMWRLGLKVPPRESRARFGAGRR